MISLAEQATAPTAPAAPESGGALALVAKLQAEAVRAQPSTRIRRRRLSRLESLQLERRFPRLRERLGEEQFGFVVDWSRGDAGGAQDERQLFAAARPRPGGEVRMEGFAVGAPARFSVQPGGRRPGFANRLRQLRPLTGVLHFERQPFVFARAGEHAGWRMARAVVAAPSGTSPGSWTKRCFENAAYPNRP